MNLYGKAALFAGGVLFGSAGLKLLASKDAKKVYTHTLAAALRVKESGKCRGHPGRRGGHQRQAGRSGDGGGGRFRRSRGLTRTAGYIAQRGPHRGPLLMFGGDYEIRDQA